ncbi:MAG: DUF4878 domain-containing protein [Pyrinomonadaceae bacterium]
MKYLSVFNSRSVVIVLSLGLAIATVSSGCSKESAANANANAAANAPVSNTSSATNAANSDPGTRGAIIPIDPNGPADTVRVFYKNLREKKFREAIFLTNLRPAVEGLTETDLNEFSLDFEKLAGQIPAEVEINGEIVTGDKATVTVNLPGKEDKIETQTIKLEKSGDVWIIQTVDADAQKRIKKEGKQYFYNLRMETHQEEAKKMLERISKAELAYSLQNNRCADLETLVVGGLLPDDVKTSESTGYNYVVTLTTDGKSYHATATPAEYGKSGKMSYILKLDAKGQSHVSGKDNGGKVLAQ